MSPGPFPPGSCPRLLERSLAVPLSCQGVPVASWSPRKRRHHDHCENQNRR